MDAIITLTNGILSVLGLLLGLVIWMLKRNSDALTSQSLDIAIIKNTISDVKADHEKLTVLDYKHTVLKSDINAAHNKLRDIISNH